MLRTATGRVVVIGAGIGGLVAAIELARAGLQVTVYERQAGPGGKVHDAHVDGVPVDCGPTVLTMKWVFDEIFARAGADIADRLPCTQASILARHYWDDGTGLALHSDLEQSIDAVAAFAGADAAKGFAAFHRDARRVYDVLDARFMRRARPSPWSLARDVGLFNVGDLLAIRPFASLWRTLGQYFPDPRLRQLFARYATYCGSSPFAAPATLMLVAHVEQLGVWFVDGGMTRLAAALARVAGDLGVTIHYAADVESIDVRHGRAAGVRLRDDIRVPATAIVSNADVGAIAGGLLGSDVQRQAGLAAPALRSLSAVTWACHATVDGPTLDRHNVFFSNDYAAEFAALAIRRGLPATPTVYVCAQDRGHRAPTAGQPERLFCLINAPAAAERLNGQEIEACEHRTFERLAQMGLAIRWEPSATVRTTPADFAKRFPGSDGALYGQATEGWRTSFTRPGARTRLPGLYLTGGSVHPGPGVPMAALSGTLAANCVIEDCVSTRRYRPAAMPGGTSTL